MSQTTRYTIEHVVAANQPYDQVVATLEARSYWQDWSEQQSRRRARGGRL